MAKGKDQGRLGKGAGAAAPKEAAQAPKGAAKGSKKAKKQPAAASYETAARKAAGEVEDLNRRIEALEDPELPDLSERPEVLAERKRKVRSFS